MYDASKKNGGKVKSKMKEKFLELESYQNIGKTG